VRPRSAVAGGARAKRRRRYSIPQQFPPNPPQDRAPRPPRHPHPAQNTPFFVYLSTDQRATDGLAPAYTQHGYNVHL